jgi:hypothetical protein
MTSEPDPPWPRQAAGAIAHEILGWLRALGAVLSRPRAFAAAWAAGESQPLNPLAYSLNTLAIAGPVTALLVHLAGVEDDVLPLWAQLCKPLLPWIYNLVWLTPMHFGLRLVGGRRRLRTTIGASFYAGGAIHLLRVFTAPLSLLQLAHPHDLRLALTSAAGGLVMFVVYAIYTTAVMAGAHQLPRWRAAIVVVVMFVVSVAFWFFIRARAGAAGLHLIRAMIT